MNLHVFNDSHGFVLNVTVDRFEKAGALGNNQFINLRQKTIYKNNRVTYLKKNLRTYKRFVTNCGDIDSVTFYPLDDTAAWFFKEFIKVKPGIRVYWVFWSYEFYHTPGRRELLFDQYSTTYYSQQQTIITQIKRMGTIAVKKLIGIPYHNQKLLNEAWRQVNTFFSFLPQDYKNVFSEVKSDCTYSPISFLSIEKITNGLKPASIGFKIMVGHAASPTANHAELFEQLSRIGINNNIVIPLEYGEAQYRLKIKQIASGLFPNQVEFLENRLSMTEYYQKLSDIGFAVFNFRRQEALGNILFLVWNGAKVFLNDASSVYKQFRMWGLTVFSISSDLNKNQFEELLSPDEASRNKKILENLFSENKVKKYWEVLMRQESACS